MPRVLVMESVIAGVLAHLQEQRIEMGGLLLGTVYEGLSGGVNVRGRQPNQS
jgi:hypothetical protein